MYKGNIIAAIWLVGLILVFLLDIFWPGIFVVTAVSLVAKKLLPTTLDDPAE